jgi:hypothetical protein
MNGQRGIFIGAIEFVFGIEVALLLWHLLRLLLALALIALLVHFTIGIPAAIELVRAEAMQARDFLQGVR